MGTPKHAIGLASSSLNFETISMMLRKLASTFVRTNGWSKERKAMQVEDREIALLESRNS